MKIYVACHDRELARQAADRLELLDHEIVSRWINMPFNPTETHTIEERKTIALMDAEDVAAADHLLLIAGPNKYSGGKFVEAGIALGLGKGVTILGWRENMLLWHPAIRQIDTLEEFGGA